MLRRVAIMIDWVAARSSRPDLTRLAISQVLFLAIVVITRSLVGTGG